MWKCVAGVFVAYLTYKGIRYYQQLSKILNNQTECKEAQVYDTYIYIPYKYCHNDYSLRLPYDASKVVKMNNYTVEAIDGTIKYDITQQPGIPYLITCQDLECDQIIVNDFNDDQQRVFFKAKPYYGE